MKNLLAEIKVKEYFLRLNPLQAKKILFAMEQMKGNDRMDESDYTELRQIAGMYDGIINASFARDLAKRLVTEYSNSHPDVFMTQKEANCYTEANHAKLLTALGLRGFDYVMAVLRQGKEYVSDRANGVDEYRMLQAMRWDEQRENIEPTISKLSSKTYNALPSSLPLFIPSNIHTSSLTQSSPS